MDWVQFFIGGCLGLFVGVGVGIRDGDHRWFIFRKWSMVDEVGMVNIRGWGGKGASGRHAGKEVILAVAV